MAASKTVLVLLCQIRGFAPGSDKVVLVRGVPADDGPEPSSLLRNRVRCQRSRMVPHVEQGKGQPPSAGISKSAMPVERRPAELLDSEHLRVVFTVEKQRDVASSPKDGQNQFLRRDQRQIKRSARCQNRAGHPIARGNRE